MSYSANVIAKYIINHCTEKAIGISNLKLQMLLYFAWIEYYKATRDELYHDDICARPLGPVIPGVYSEFCAFGGKPIKRKYNIALAHGEDELFLSNFLEEYAALSASRLVDMSRLTGEAWDVTFNGGEGNSAPIPFELIKVDKC